MSLNRRTISRIRRSSAGDVSNQAMPDIGAPRVLVEPISLARPWLRHCRTCGAFEYVSPVAGNLLAPLIFPHVGDTGGSTSPR